jgi:hypothetical protein
MYVGRRFARSPTKPRHETFVFESQRAIACGSMNLSTRFTKRRAFRNSGCALSGAPFTEQERILISKGPLFATEVADFDTIANLARCRTYSL